jgi:hypothetical protein
MSLIQPFSLRLTRHVIPAILFFTIFFGVALTSSDYGITWDEPYYFHASDLHIHWVVGLLKNMMQGELAKSFEDNAIAAAWHWDPYHVPHPPFSRIVSGLTKLLFSPFIDKFTAYRLGPALFFAGLVTAMYVWITTLCGRLTGWFAALMLVFTPNLFGFAHFAVADMPLTTVWFLTVYGFWKGLENWRWSVALGAIWGLALSTKFPALLIPLPLLLWAHLFQRKSYQNNVFSMVFLSPIVMIACQPYLWHETTLRALEFLNQGLTRGYSSKTDFVIFFLNNYYSTSAVPWYFTFFMTAVTIPETVLVLFMIGLFAILRQRPTAPVAGLFAINTIFILILGLFPGAVLHDVNRQMLPVLPWVVGLAAFGFFLLGRFVVTRCERIKILQHVRSLRAKLSIMIFVLASFPAGLDLLVYHPYELSYYNRLVGGLRGAYKRGLEVTYYMEALNPTFLKYLNTKLPPNSAINGHFSNFMLEYYQRENRLRQDLRITRENSFNYYVLLNRRSVFIENDQAFETVHPSLYDALRLDGVPLILIYKSRNYEE